MSHIEELRSQIEKSRNGKYRGAVRYDAGLRERVVSHAKTALASGETLPGIARCLEIATVTLRRWMEPAAEGAALRPVTLTTTERPTGCVLVSPGGYRVEGLSTDEAARLLALLA